MFASTEGLEKLSAVPRADMVVCEFFTAGELSSIRNAPLDRRVFCARIGTSGSSVYEIIETIDRSSTASNWMIMPPVRRQGVPQEHIQPDHGRILEEIRSTLGLSVTGLARIFGVSRQAVHGWLKGESVSLQNAARIEELRRAATVLTGAGAELSLASLNRPLFQGRSFLSLVSTGEGLEEAAQKVVTALAREKDQREHMAGIFAGLPKPALEVSDFASPGMDERG